MRAQATTNPSVRLALYEKLRMGNFYNVMNVLFPEFR